jgi:carbon monoxide dehydrogenase subunit G
MAIWTDRIEIDASAAHCFAVLSDIDTCGVWITQVKQIEKQYEGPIKVGDQWLETRTEGKGKREHRMAITLFEQHGPDHGAPPYIHTAGADVMGGRSFYRFIVTPTTNNQCTVTLEAAFEVKGWLKQQFAKLIVRMMQKTEKDLLSRLKAHCEATTS